MRWIALLLLATTTHAVALTDVEQGCIDALGEAGRAVAAAQAAQSDACLDPAAALAPADVAPCVANDDTPALAEARQATFDAALASCQALPAFGVARTVDEAVTTAATVHTRRLFDDAFGSAGGALVFDAADTRGRRCQASTLHGATTVLARYLDRFGVCTRKALAGGASDAAALEACAASALRGPVTRARKRLSTTARRRCRKVDLAAAFAGPCGSGSTTEIGRCLGTRAVCRACRVANAMHGLAADCDQIDDGSPNGSCRFPVTLSGDAIPFDNGPDGRVADATITLVEHPGRVVVTGADGRFVFDDLDEGSDVTVVLQHPDYHLIQTGTIRLGPTGVDRVTFQAVTTAIYNLLAVLLDVVPDEANRCQMVTTVTRVGKSIYDPGAHGEEGVTVTLDPPLPAEHGPIYFNSSVLPDRSLTETSDDGGVLFIQVPPGDYVWTAHKAGAVFSRIAMRCRAGVLVNASPPKGLQRH